MGKEEGEESGALKTSQETEPIEIDLKKGWLGRQMTNVTNDMQRWPDWMRREAGLGKCRPDAGPSDSQAALQGDAIQRITGIREAHLVSWPAHYTFGKIQPIDVIEDWQLNHHLATAVAYIARAGRKDPNTLVLDLEKAVWYLNRFIAKTKADGSGGGTGDGTGA